MLERLITASKHVFDIYTITQLIKADGIASCPSICACQEKNPPVKAGKKVRKALVT